jgi:hypothetical protein
MELHLPGHEDQPFVALSHAKAILLLPSAPSSFGYMTSKTDTNWINEDD